MPQADELRRRAREAESAGDLNDALERYRQALDLQREPGDHDGRETGLLLRIADLHARLDHRRRALEAYYEASEGYVRQGLVSNAIAVCNRILRAYPDEIRAHRLLAEHQLEIGLAADARASLLRGLEAARRDGTEAGGEGGDGPPDAADEAEALVEAARRFLRSDPDQEVCLELAALLREQGRGRDALEVLRRVWEERTGLRKPAGKIEARAREIDPSVDLGAWTPVWPPSTAGAGEEAARGPAGAGAPVEGGRAAEASPERGGGAAASGTLAPGEGGPGSASREAGPDAGSPEAGRVAASRERAGPGPRDDGGEDAWGWAGNGGGEAQAGAREPGGPGEGREASAPPAGRAAAEAGRAEGLARGLEVVEELIELAPDDLGLRRRKVAYARRLGDPERLEEALLDLAEALAEGGHGRGARMVYEHVLDRLRPGSRRAESGLEALRAAAPAGEPVAPGPAARGPAPEAGERPEEGSGRDAAFRRRLSSALRDAPRSLSHLHAAAEAAARRPGEAVPAVAHLRLARFLLLRGRPWEALEHLETARSRGAPGEEAAETLYHLGRALARCGDREAAAARFRELAAIDPGVAVARAALYPEAGPGA